MLKKKNYILTLLILLLFGLLFWGISFSRKMEGKYFVPLKTQNGWINFLILGINGYGGADSNLTDTIIFLSMKTSGESAILLSIPRDIWIEGIKAKINTAYHYGGIDMAEKTIGEMLSQPIDYYLIINFNSFEKIIDFLGGINVWVDQAFDDYKYPITGREKDLCNGDKELKCRYEQIHFGAGFQKMDGKTALKYVRSRNAVGEEGTDFARSVRQQKVISAIKEKIVSEKLYLHPKKAREFLKLLQSEIITNITPREYGNLAVIGYRFWQAGANFTQISIENFLTNPKYHYSKQWVLLPKTGNWEEIREYVRGKLGE